MPFVFFLLLEGALRLTGYGADYPLFESVPNHTDYLSTSRDAGKRYFTANAAPSIPFASFKAAKPDSTFRVFVQGGSSAAGFPFYYGASFSDILEKRLQDTFLDRDIEVVNTSMAAVNSYTLLDFADEVIAQKPDAVLIYAGHNEFYGALGVGSAESIGVLRPVVNVYLRLRHFRMVQGLRAVLSKTAGLFASRPDGESPSGTLMKRMVAKQSIPYRSTDFEYGLRQFQGNLADLLARYAEKDIPVYVGTLASNERDQRPFVSGLSAETDAEAWQAQFRQAINAALTGDTTAALAALDVLIQEDSLAANAYFAKARLLDAAGRVAEARPAYLAAKDRDQLPFRAPEAFNDIIREEAARHGATVVEVQQKLAMSSPGGIIGNNVMIEHLHPNIAGYMLMAEAFYESLHDANVLTPWQTPSTPTRSAMLATAVDSLSGMYRIRQLMSGWPFQPPGVVDENLRTIRAESPEEKIAFAYYNDELSWGAAQEQLRALYASQGDQEKALQATLATILRYPFRSNPHLLAGNTYLEMGRYDEALRAFAASNAIQETATAQRMMGSILLQQQQTEAATHHLERAQALDPTNAQTLYNLSGAYAMGGNFAQARTTAERLLAQHPDHTAARQLLASLPE